ncbi:hypothetical protein G6F57_021159 [Rhizopus arrhizus]|nr:hypothetical protein G6F57_021159 [Rhizopus arrhizus]
MTRGLRAVGDDADLGADQGIGQGRLAHVRAADDGHAAAMMGSLFAHLESSCSRTAAAACCSASRREAPSPSVLAAGSATLQRSRKWWA